MLTSANFWEYILGQPQNTFRSSYCFVATAVAFTLLLGELYQERQKAEGNSGSCP